MTSTGRDALRAQLIEHEGERLKAYRCSAGFITVGVGRNLEGNGISQAESRYLLDNDINRCVNEAVNKFPWFPDLDEVRQRVIVDMCFQLGIYGLMKFRTTLKYVAEKQYGLAAEAMLQSEWARQTPVRANRLARWMSTGSATGF